MPSSAITRRPRAVGSYRFLKNLKGIVGYDYRTRGAKGQKTLSIPTPDPIRHENIPRTERHIYRGELIYNPSDWLGARLKYQKLFRNTDTISSREQRLSSTMRVFDIGKRTRICGSSPAT